MSSRFDVAERARKEMQEIGGKCGNNNKYTHWYSDNVENIGYNFWWCAAFVSYVVRQCGVPTSIVPNYSYCPNCIDWARRNGRRYGFGTPVVPFFFTHCIESEFSIILIPLFL